MKAAGRYLFVWRVAIYQIKAGTSRGNSLFYFPWYELHILFSLISFTLFFYTQFSLTYDYKIIFIALIGAP